MKWRIRESAHGGFVAERGIETCGGSHVPGIIGATMPAFIIYESAHFDTEREAKAYVKHKQVH